ncbi:alpha/beta-hydrolase [Colletotrichum sublineola]|uniref:Putative cholinesterase n=1 Tax=Colletotrichum sublineola TaxID=1173701 RepID=A0A066XS60_COLSU|nr:alpha/beta-hydrolase [Colletotrichum sublineola]KDN68591.1 putative cholinesterase [Colletotrichum sublineola]
MGLHVSSALGLAYLAGAIAYPATVNTKLNGTSISVISLTLLYQNNLNFTDDVNHIGTILLDHMTLASGAEACAAIGESLISQAAIQDHISDFEHSLAYNAYTGRASQRQSYMIKNGTVTVDHELGELVFGHALCGQNQTLPVLCTQSSNQNMAENAVPTSANEITVASKGNTFVGFRNQKSFRFQGIPFADPPSRFEYSTLYSPKGQVIDATAYGPNCAQGSDPNSIEDCLFVKIQTPYIPKAGSTKDLRPVHLWIHGGGFTGGNGADAGSDGGQLAAREDVVVVEINYRLSTLGFLAVPGTNIAGNYGIADQVVGIEWVIENIAAFDGDPDKIVISGGSAGAGSVRTHLGSPRSIGKFRGAIAMSNLGGGVDLGLDGDYGTTYSSYLSIADSYNRSAALFSEAGCDQSTMEAQVACLRTIPAQTIVNLPTVARYVVQDGIYVTTETLNVYSRNGSTASVNTIWGNIGNDGASFSTYPTEPIGNQTQGLMVGLGISQAYAQDIIDSGLFPYYDTGNATLDSFNVTQRVATDKTFRCIDQATVYAGVHSGAFKTSYYYQLERSYGGYNPNNVDATGPIEPGYPNGNPEQPYFRLHGGDMPWVFANLYTTRNENDLRSVQLSSAYFASFVRELQPNPGAAYLSVRGYTNTSAGVAASGPWQPVSGLEGPIKRLDVVSRTDTFQDVEQCSFLNYSITYYIDGGLKKTRLF